MSDSHFSRWNGHGVATPVVISVISSFPTSAAGRYYLLMMGLSSSQFVRASLMAAMPPRPLLSAAHTLALCDRVCADDFISADTFRFEGKLLLASL